MSLSLDIAGAPWSSASLHSPPDVRRDTWDAPRYPAPTPLAGPVAGPPRCSERATECILVLAVYAEGAEHRITDPQERQAVLDQASQDIERAFLGRRRPEFDARGPFPLREITNEADLPKGSFVYGYATFGTLNADTLPQGGGEIDSAVCKASDASHEATPIPYQDFDKIVLVYEDSSERFRERIKTMEWQQADGSQRISTEPIGGAMGGTFFGRAKPFKVVDCRDPSKSVRITNRRVGTLFLVPESARPTGFPAVDNPSEILFHEYGHSVGAHHQVTRFPPRNGIAGGAYLDSSDVMGTIGQDGYLSGPHLVHTGDYRAGEVARIPHDIGKQPVTLRARNAPEREDIMPRLFVLETERGWFGLPTWNPRHIAIEVRARPADDPSHAGRFAFPGDNLDEDYGVRIYRYRDHVLPWEIERSVERSIFSFEEGRSGCINSTLVEYPEGSVQREDGDITVTLQIEPNAESCEQVPDLF